MPFGGLKPLPRKEVQKAVVYKDDCYICNDPDIARYGLPMCYPCRFCGGHVAADAGICDVCHRDQNTGEIPVCVSCGEPLPVCWAGDCKVGYSA